MELSDTIEFMKSDEYKDRFKAEYFQTKIRYDKLHKTLVKYDAGKLAFTPTCPVDMLRDQARKMGEYLYILEMRAVLEDINIGND